MAGLLNEIHSEMDRIHFVILGIGVNLNMDEKDVFERDPGSGNLIKERDGTVHFKKGLPPDPIGGVGNMV